jgi:hypothetical protein
MRTPLLPFVLLLSACPATDRSGFWDEGQDDDDATSDDDDAVADDDDGGPQLGPGGSIGIWYWEQADPSGSGLMVGGGFIGHFWEDISAGTPGTRVNGPMDWDSPQGPDDCSVNVWDEADLETTGGTPGVSEERDAGVITLSSPSWSVDIEPWPTTTQHSQYYFELEPALATQFDTYYDIDVEGDEFPAFQTSADLLVHDALHLVDPAAVDGFTLDGADLDITWTGGSADTIWIELHHGSTLEFDNASINCVALNDGSFTIPGDMIAQLPADVLLNLTLGQPRNVTVVVGDIEVDVGSSASTMTNGTRVP